MTTEQPGNVITQDLFFVLFFATITQYRLVAIERDIMSKKAKSLLTAINILFFCILVLSVAIPVERKAETYSNTDISDFSGHSSIPRIGAITDGRELELKFDLYDKKLYGVGLYFCVEGEDESGAITCTIKHEGETIAQDTFLVKELAFFSNTSTLKNKEILLDDPQTGSGEYTILLEGEDISPQTRISLFGNSGAERYLKYENEWCGEYLAPLYVIETLESKRPYIWAASFLFVMGLLFTYIIYVNAYISQKEKHFEVTE